MNRQKSASQLRFIYQANSVFVYSLLGAVLNFRSVDGEEIFRCGTSIGMKEKPKILGGCLRFIRHIACQVYFTLVGIIYYYYISITTLRFPPNIIIFFVCYICMKRNTLQTNYI